MFKKENRLNQNRDIQATFARGRSFFNPLIQIKYFARVGAKISRFTVVAGIKVDKRAVRRNRIKRIIRNGILQYKENLPFGDYAIFVKPPAGKAEDDQIKNALKELCEKILK